MKALRALLYMATWQKLPMLPRDYSTDYDLAEVDRDTQRIMQLARVRCPQGVTLLEDRHKASRRQLARDLDFKRRRRRPLRRLVGYVQRALGVTPYDPMHGFYLEHQRRIRRESKRLV